MKSDFLLRELNQAVLRYWDVFEFFCVTYPIPILPIARGSQLDSLGALCGVHRDNHENDNEFRERICAYLERAR